MTKQLRTRYVYKSEWEMAGTEIKGDEASYDIQTIKDILDEIEAVAATMDLQFPPRLDVDDSHGMLSFGLVYDEYETDEEYKERLSQEAAVAAFVLDTARRSEAAERTLLAQLKAKYEE